MTPWDSVVAIDTLGSQGPLGHGFRLNERLVLTSEAVARQFPFVAVELLSKDPTDNTARTSVQAEPLTTGEIGGVVLRLFEPIGAAVPGFRRARTGDAFQRCETP